MIPPMTTDQLFAELIEDRVMPVPLELLARDPSQPRRHFDRARLNDLAADIRANGVLQPITVRRDGARFVVVLGERRLRAAGLAGLEAVPCLLSRAEPETATEPDAEAVLERKFQQLAENHHRDALSPIDLAWFLRALRDDFGLSATAIAQHLRDRGFREMGRSYVANTIAITELPERYQEAIEAGRLRPGHGKYVRQLARAGGDAALAAFDLDLDEVLQMHAEEGSPASATEGEVRESVRHALGVVGVHLTGHVPRDLYEGEIPPAGEYWRVAFDWQTVCTDCAHRHTFTVDGDEAVYCMDRAAFLEKQRAALAPPAPPKAAPAAPGTPGQLDVDPAPPPHRAEDDGARQARREKVAREHLIAWARGQILLWAAPRGTDGTPPPRLLLLVWAALGQPLAQYGECAATSVPWRDFPAERLAELGMGEPSAIAETLAAVHPDADPFHAVIDQIVDTMNERAVVAWARACGVDLAAWRMAEHGEEYLSRLDKGALLVIGEEELGLSVSSSDKHAALVRRIRDNAPDKWVPPQLVAAWGSLVGEQ